MCVCMCMLHMCFWISWQDELHAKRVMVFEKFGSMVNSVALKYEQNKLAPARTRNSPAVAGNIMRSRAVERDLRLRAQELAQSAVEIQIQELSSSSDEPAQLRPAAASVARVHRPVGPSWVKHPGL